jgi:hypothetical protein
VGRDHRKLTTALAGNSAPDVIDVGNTQVASYAATGGLADLTAYRTQLEQGQKWLGGLVDPATVDGKLYAVPSFAGDRAVVYNKKVWADAGVTEVPKMCDEADRGAGQDQGEEHRQRLLRLLPAGPVLVRGHAVRLGCGRRDRHREGRHLVGRALRRRRPEGPEGVHDVPERLLDPGVDHGEHERAGSGRDLRQRPDQRRARHRAREEDSAGQPRAHGRRDRHLPFPESRARTSP